MQFLIFIPLIALTLVCSIRLHGLFSFVTLGVAGAAIYNIPAIVDLELPLSSFAYKQPTLFPTPNDADLVVALAWVAMLVGILVVPRSRSVGHGAAYLAVEERVLRRYAAATSVLAAAGIAYILVTQGAHSLIAPRGNAQTTDAVTLLWKWTAPLGLIAASLGRARKLLIYHALILFVIFLRGDRSLIAITAAALIVATNYRNPKWYLFFTPTRMVGAGFALAVVFLGKSIYIPLKSLLAGEGWISSSRTFQEQLIGQFEPFITYAHLDFVMAANLHFGFVEFAESVLANLLIVPSYFGLSTNLYSETVTSALPPEIAFGIAGNYLAHGWTVGGTFGAMAFYFLLVLMLRLCDVQFYRRRGAPKLFWCAVGGTLAFYAHRNGLDNLFSFIRQIAIVCFAIAAARGIWLLLPARSRPAPPPNRPLARETQS